MDKQDLKKFLAGFGIAGLIAGLTPVAGAGEAGSGTGAATEQSSATQDPSNETKKDEQVSAPTTSVNGTDSKGKPTQPAPSSG